MYLYFLSRTNVSEGMKFVFGFTNKCFRVARDDLNNVPMEGLELKPMKINFQSANNIYM